MTIWRRSALQTITIELNKEAKTKTNKQTKHTHIRLAIISIWVDVSKLDDEVYVLSIIKIYNYFLLAFSVVPKKVELLKISKML